MTAPTQANYAGDLYHQAALFQDQVEALDRQAAQALTNAWADVYGRIRVDLDDVLGKIAHAKALGEPVKPGWLYQQDRLKSVLKTTKAELARYGTVAGVVTKGQQASAVLAGVKHAKAQVQTAAHPLKAVGVEAEFTDVDPENLKHLVGHLANGSPLRALFDSIPTQGARELERRLVQGVALGWNPEKIARHVQTGLGLSKQRAILIARTETLRSYREATRTAYLGSSVVVGWVWTSALDKRTCVACVAMHGTLHPNTERLDGHPACRCRMVPRTPTWKDLGIDLPGDTNPPIPTGADWLQAQDPAVQKAILGPGKWQAYASGQYGLQDMVARRFSPAWGTTRSERSLKDMAAGVNGDYGPHLDAGTARPRRPTPVTHLPEGYYGTPLPPGYHGQAIPITHPAYSLPVPDPKGVAKVLAKIDKGQYTKQDLTKIVGNGKYKNSAKPLKPQDYANHKRALEELDAHQAAKASAKAADDALTGKVDTTGWPEPDASTVAKWKDALDDGTFSVKELEDLAEASSSLNSKANITEALKQHKAAKGTPINPDAADAWDAMEAHGGLPPGSTVVTRAPDPIHDWPDPPFRTEDLTLDPSVRLGGAHTKEVYTSPDGRKWLYKPQDEFRATLDRSVAAIQERAGLKTPETYLVELRGRPGSIQELLPSRNAFGDSPSAFDVTRLSAHDVLELQKHDVFDWLVSNHDGHAQQYIRGKGPGGPNNPIIGIDKGQAFRFFGKDRLDVDYEPNAQYGVTKVSNLLNRAHAQGRDVTGWHDMNQPGTDLRKFAETLRDLPDAQYRAILRPYAEQAQARGFLATGSNVANDVERFLDAAVDRKRTLVTDYERFHADLADARHKALGTGPYAPPKPDAPHGLKGMDVALEHDRAQGPHDTPHEGHAWGSKHYPLHKMQADLTDAEKSAISKYTGSAYRPVNDHLRGVHPGGDAVQRLADRVQAAAERHPIPEDVILHRATGFGGIEAMARNAGIPMAHGRDLSGLVGSTLTDQGFMSSSVGQFPKYGDLTVVLKIRANAGTPGVYVSNGLSSLGQREYEFVLGRGLSFYVHEATRTNKYQDYGDAWVLDVEILPTAPVKKAPRKRAPRKATP